MLSELKFEEIYVACGYTDLHYGIDGLARIHYRPWNKEDKTTRKHAVSIATPSLVSAVIHGKLVCDGYQVYHIFEDREDTRFKVAGCWIHARRPFAQIYKSPGEEKAMGTVAIKALAQIQNIYHTDNQLLKLPPSEQKKRRKNGS